MTEHKYHSIIQHYEECLATYGVCLKGMDWPNDQDAFTRYSVMLDVIRENQDVSLLDLGCGAGFLLDFIKQRGIKNVDYWGIDASRKMIEAAHTLHPDKRFIICDILNKPLSDRSVDYIIMNGVLTEKRGLSYSEMECYAKELIKTAYNACKIGIAFNVMSTYVDWMREDLFHWDIRESTSFVVTQCSHNFTVRMDYGLHEYTVYIYRESLL